MTRLDLWWRVKRRVMTEIMTIYMWCELKRYLYDISRNWTLKPKWISISQGILAGICLYRNYVRSSWGNFDFFNKTCLYCTLPGFFSITENKTMSSRFLPPNCMFQNRFLQASHSHWTWWILCLSWLVRNHVSTLSNT